MNEKNTNNNLETFVEKLYMEKNFPNDLEKEVIDQIKSDLLKSVENRINAVIISNLPEEKFQEFEDLLDKNGSEEEIQGFCQENIPNVEQIIASELISFRQNYLS
jgi:hypothetical protein